MTDNIVGQDIVPPARYAAHRWRRSLFRRRRRQGHGRPFPTPPTAWRRKPGSGWTTPSPGGSAGYDHKKMGITARGAWEAVKRHFREMESISRRRPSCRRGRGHVRRRFRQRHAAVGADAPDRRLRSPRHLHRSRSGRRRNLADASDVRPAAVSWQDFMTARCPRAP